MHFDQNKTIGALGTLVAAKWYRSNNRKQLLISLDSAEARRWMNFDDDGRRADLLGFTVVDGTPVIDILEVKSGKDARQVYSLSPDGVLSGKPIEQLLNTTRSIKGIFGLNELRDHILTPPRREILRNHFYRQGFSAQWSPTEKQEWGDALNSLFAGETVPDIRANLVVVNLGVNQEAVDTVFAAGSASVRLVHLNETAVNLELSSSSSSVSVRATTEQSAVGTEEAEPREHAIVTQITSLERVEPPLKAGDLKRLIEATCGRLRAACQDYQIRVSEIDPEIVDVGPSVIRYKILLAPGEQGEKLRKQAENLARQLATETIPVIDRLPGTNYMYLDLARPDRQEVLLDPLLKQYQIHNLNELPLNVGVDPSGKSYRLDLGDDRFPHLLVAGGTGSGKTIFLYSVVLSLVAAHSERSLELVIIDPKQTDFAKFGILPQLRNHTV
jgi:FtsK/SpoIIIE family/FtsK alpha domain